MKPSLFLPIRGTLSGKFEKNRKGACLRFFCHFFVKKFAEQLECGRPSQEIYQYQPQSPNFNGAYEFLIRNDNKP